MIKQSVFVKQYLNKIKSLCDLVDVKNIADTLDILNDVYEEEKTIFVVGNGGSASTASHLVCDLGKTIIDNKRKKKKKGFKIICLSDNIPLLTALSNDCSYRVVFSEQLKNLGGENDLLLVISGSGNSPNITEAIKIAKKKKMRTMAFLGFDGGKAKSMVDSYILVPSNEYGPIEDFHLILNHLITLYFKNKLED